MAQIVDDRPAYNPGSETYRHIGCIELPGNMDNFQRKEVVINIKQKLEQKGWKNVADFEQGSDQHVFVFEIAEPDAQVIFPEKPNDDWTEATEGYKSIYLNTDE